MADRIQLALWGYGYYGKDFEAVLKQSWADTCTVTALFD